jgi:hypothetical protein
VPLVSHTKVTARVTWTVYFLTEAGADAFLTCFCFLALSEAFGLLSPTFPP